MSKLEETKRISELLSLLNQTYPDASTQLKFKNPFELMVATILAAQCTDKRVNQVTESLFQKYKGPEDFARADLNELEQDIKTCGLFRNKSKNIKEASQMLVEKYGGQVPDDLEKLIELPGVGRKTANVILANAFRKPAFAVDTHVYRLAHRLGLSDKKDMLGVEKDLMQKIPQDKWIEAHHWLIHHGRSICQARSPKCKKCPVSHLCPSDKQKKN